LGQARVSLTSPASSAQERGRRWALEHIIEAQGGPVTDVTLTLEHPLPETETWSCPQQTLEPGNRRVRTYLTINSPTALTPDEDLGDGELVARYVDPNTGERYRQSVPVRVRHMGTLDLSAAGPERVEPDVRVSVVEDRGEGMQVEECHGYTISSEPGEHAINYRSHWFHVDQRGGAVFDLEIKSPVLTVSKLLPTEHSQLKISTYDLLETA